MNFEYINIKEEAEYQVIELKGRLTYDYIAEYKVNIIENIKEAKGYIIDLSSIIQVDSTGMGLLVNTAKHFISNQQRMVLIINDKLILELFTIAKLDKVFNICKDMKEAKDVLALADDDYVNRVNEY